MADGSGPRWALLREAGILAAFAALAVLKAGLWRDLDGSLFAGPDSLKDVWVLQWVAGHLHQPARVFEGNNFFPSHDAILFSDPLLGPALLAAPVLALGGGPVLAYNVAVLLTLALGSYGFFLLAQRLGAGRRAALLAAVTVPYMPTQMQHLSHLNLLTLGGFPYLVLGLMRLLAAPSLAVACATGFVFAWQAGTSGYWAFAAVFLCAVVAGWSWRALARVRTSVYLWVAAAVAGAFLLPYVRGFLALRATEAALERSTIDREDLSVDLVSGLWGTSAWVWQGVMPGHHEAATLAFPGALVVVLAVAGLRRGPRRSVTLLALIAVLFFLLALGPRVKVLGVAVAPGPAALLEAGLPLFTAVRHPATFVVLTLAALGLLASLGASALGLTRRWWTTAALLGLVLLETAAPPHRRVPVDSRLPAVYGRLRQQPRAAILELPLSAEGDSLRQWWSVHHGLDLVNGVGAFAPDRYVRLTRLVARDWARGSAGSLEDTPALSFLKHQFPIGYVLVHPEASETLRRSLELTPSLEPLFDEQGTRVYRLRTRGIGRVLRRAFRDDQLRDGLVVARVRGPTGTVLHARFNGVEVGRTALTEEPRMITWVVRPLTRRGLNAMVLTAEGPGRPELELLEVTSR